jgi:large subunit ribosomal protein L23
MKDPYQIILRPLITEKSSDQAQLFKYHFKVAKDANKIEIAEAIKVIYAKDNPRVTAVNTLNVKGKKRRAQVRGGKSGYTPDWKKAIVTTEQPLASLYEEMGI